MNFIPGEDAEELREVVRDFLEKRSAEDEVRRLMETESGYNAVVWSQAAEGIGLTGLTVAEEHGGSGVSPVELGVVFEEAGRALFSAPLFATVGLATPALQEVADADASARLLPGIVGGRTATLAWAGRSPGVSRLQGVGAAANGWRLSGVAPIVVDGASTDLLLVAASTPSGISLFEVDTAATGLTRTALTALDQTRRLAELTFDGVAATLIGEEGGSGPALDRAFALAALYLAAEQLGGAALLLAMSTEYASTRIQFGRAIGSFQAIKHRCADMLVDVESARSVVYHGLWTAAHDPDDLLIAAALARSVASDAFQRAAADTIQIHGGIGFTWEHPAHLYLKRAKSSQLLLGSPTNHRSDLVELLSTAPTVAEPPDAEQGVAVADRSEAERLEGAVAAFLAEHVVPDPADKAAEQAFREARFDAGLAVVSLPEGHGGLGLDSSFQPVVENGFADAGASDHTARNVIGLGMAIPTINAHGTEEQKQRFLRPCFSSEEIWCQLFSEPGAGSDLAALATRAVRDGDEFVVNGQKIWTSLGHVARFGILIARTDPDVPKHRGLTYFLLDMTTPGVEVRPLRQLTGEDEFNEVYLTDVRVPVDNVLGEVGSGWRVAMTTLANERVSLGRRVLPRGGGPISRATEVYRAAVADGRATAATTERYALLWTRAEASRLTNARAAAQIGVEPGPEGSIAKLQMAELNKAVYEFCVDMSGTDGLLIDGYGRTAPVTTAVHGGADLRKSYLRSLANSVEGGTSEVLRNILGERVLGLPGEPRIDRDIPWKETRRS